MKESRFIELLNLYIDQQLSPAEAAELEAEVQRSPQRRRTYAQYCRMQKACTLLFEAERAHAPKTAAAIMAARKAESAGTLEIFPVSPPQRLWRGAMAVGAVAAAACVVLVGLRVVQAPSTSSLASSNAGSSVAVVSSPQTPSSSVVAPVSSANSQTELVALAGEVPVSIPASQRPAFQSVLIANALRLSPEADFESASATELRAPMLDWLNRVTLEPVRVRPDAEMAFDGRPSLTTSEREEREDRSFRSRRSFQSSSELTAFQFQR